MLKFAQAWEIVYFLITLFMQANKRVNSGSDGYSVANPFLTFLDSLVRNYLIINGNRSESLEFIAPSLLFSVGQIFFILYYIIWQPVKYSWEDPLHYIALVIDVLIFCFSLLMMVLVATIPDNTNKDDFAQNPQEDQDAPLLDHQE